MARVGAGVAAFTAAAAGMYVGAEQVSALLNQPDTTVSFSTTSYETHMLRAAFHTPATKGGAFTNTTKLTTNDVQGVRNEE